MSSITTTTQWQHLAPNPKSAYKQLFIKGTRIRARVFYGLYMSAEEPMTPEEIAADYNLPLAAEQEAIAYCQTKPLETTNQSNVGVLQAGRDHLIAKKGEAHHDL